MIILYLDTVRHGAWQLCKRSAFKGFLISVRGLGFRVWGFEIRVRDFLGLWYGFRVYGLGFWDCKGVLRRRWVLGIGFQGLGLMIWVW